MNGKMTLMHKILDRGLYVRSWALDQFFMTGDTRISVCAEIDPTVAASNLLCYIM